MARTFLAASAFFSLLVAAWAAGEDDVFAIQPEIHHVFRDATNTPPAWFSQTFTVISLSPWLILLAGWFSVGVTPSKVVHRLTAGSAVRTLSIIAFIGTLVATEYLFYLYWTQLNLFQTLGYLVVLTIILFATGRYALSQVQSLRSTATK
ncbi:Oligosaccharyltransferase subunit Ribophorin II-domain-containing protein [Radiomyces spectabilis]|uniref:Oligosaccharyltransferase subunit Ribophorin II-domain-containing protein n=1 Tax=Radiomyces spectabilis TaxID=64574 RepID=UPI00221FE79D|nr:Oligosaccharyltransferase subunit Ribophorin II-domain-containing protein [Radiomyces spectabilis]KAI8366636.1 Oligosaccharyltransferase subunit Ribophorin II-domain-containing protein [Radiomyces spectabilis]